MSARKFEFGIADLYRAVCQHPYLTASVFFGTLLLAGIAHVLIPRSYQSEAKLFVRLGRENSALDPTSTLGESRVVAIPFTRKEEINSVVEMLRGRDVVTKVAEEIGPESILAGKLLAEGEEETPSFNPLDWLRSLLPSSEVPPLYAAALKLEGGLSIKSFEDTNVIKVSYVSKSTDLSQKVVDAVVSNYQQQHIRVNRAPGAHDFLSEQTDAVHEKLIAAEDALYKLKNESGLVSLVDQRAALVALVASLEQSKLQAEAEATAIAKEVDSLTEKLADVSETKVLEKTEGIASEAADGMRQALYSLEIQEQQLLAKYTPEHVSVKQIREQIANAKTILNAETLFRSQTMTGPNPVHSATELALAERQPKLIALRARIEVLGDQLSSAHDRLKKLTESEQQILTLERDAKIYDANYRIYANNLERTRIDDAMQSQAISNISVVQSPSWEPKPVFPRLSISLIGGVVAATFFSLLAAVIAQLRDQSVHTPEELEQTLGVPALVSIPRMSNLVVGRAGGRG